MLKGMKEIAAFLEISPATAYKWILNYGLPASKMPNGMWITHKSLILQWIVNGHQQMLEQRQVLDCSETNLTGHDIISKLVEDAKTA